MSGIQQWAFSICTSMVVAAIARMLLPQSGVQKVFQVTLSVFLLVCMLSPVALQNPQLRVQVQENGLSEMERRAQNLEHAAQTQSQQQMEEKIEKIIKQKLAEMGINYPVVTIHINTNGQHEAELREVELLLQGDYRSRHDEIVWTLEEYLQATVEIAYQDEESGEEDVGYEQA